MPCQLSLGCSNRGVAGSNAKILEQKALEAKSPKPFRQQSCGRFYIAEPLPLLNSPGTPGSNATGNRAELRSLMWLRMSPSPQFFHVFPHQTPSHHNPSLSKAPLFQMENPVATASSCPTELLNLVCLKSSWSHILGTCAAHCKLNLHLLNAYTPAERRSGCSTQNLATQYLGDQTVAPTGQESSRTASGHRRLMLDDW